MVDRIIASRHKPLTVHHTARRRIADLNAQSFSASGDVLLAQEVNRPACPTEAFAPHKLIGLGGIKLCCKPRIAIGDPLLAFIDTLRTIKRPLITDKMRACDTGLIIAPKRVIAVLLNAQIELAGGRRRIADFAVIAKGWEGVFRVQTLQH